MKFLRNLTIRYKLLAITLIPLLLMLVFIFNNLFKNYQIFFKMEQAQALGALNIVASDLIHELQKESGFSAGYLSSKGKKFSTDLTGQITQTDLQLSQYQQVLNQLNTANNSEQLINLIAAIDIKLNALNAIRLGVNEQSLQSKKMNDYYTKLNRSLLSINRLISTLIQDHQIKKQMNAHLYLLQNKELAGIERALLSEAFAAKKNSVKQYNQFVSLLAEQNLYLTLFLDSATTEQVKILQDTLEGGAVKEVKRIRKTVLKNKKSLRINPNYWFANASTRIEKLKTVENIIAEQFTESIVKAKALAYFNLLILISVAILALVISFTISLYLSRQIGGQIRSLSNAMIEVQEHSDLNAYTVVSSEDELGMLAHNFNQMVAHLSKLTSNVRNASAQLSQTVGEIHQIILTVDKEVSAGLSQTDMVVVAVTELDSTVQEVAANCSGTADKSQSAHDAAIKAEFLVNEANASINQLCEQINQSKLIIKLLADDSNEIGSILDVINGVATQTNLLALNAAIEAARAGELGRGFAVVADEVRSLALKTSDSTSLIQQMIEQLQDRSQQGLQAMLSSQECANATVIGFSGLFEQLKNITYLSSELSGMNLQNAAATQEQSESVDEVNRNIEYIQRSYHSTNENAAQLKRTAKDLDAVAQRLMDDVSRFAV
jgi:methyl-accepting chemotaxis protein